MLRVLRIRHVATIDDLTVEFGPGLNALTGETGAGKSIVVDALGLVTGDRADSSLVRSGADRAVVEAVFEPPFPDSLAALLDARGLDAPGEALVVRREVAVGTGGRAFVNGSPVTVAVLREIGDVLVEIHGQHEHQGLLSPERHLALLDAFGGLDDRVDLVASAYRDVADRARALEDLRASERERDEKVGRLRAIVEEIDAVAPREGEIESLDRERLILQSAGRVASLLDHAVAALYEGEPSASSLAAGAARGTAELAALDPTLADLASRLESIRVDLQDAGATLRDYRDRRDFDPARLESIETRRASLSRLMLRHGPDETAALARRKEAAEALTALEGIDVAIDEAAGALAKARARYAHDAATLGKARAAAAAALGKAVAARLRELAMPKARFVVDLVPSRALLDLPDGLDGPPLSPSGGEKAEFLLAANPGDPPRPLARVASGGELSRTMLAIHLVADGSGPAATMVFDEVDAGVGGAEAAIVGARLAQLARRHQVLCVTHWPQVAAHAESHYHVSKRLAEGRAWSDVERLSGDERVGELARMLGGLQPSAAARRNAAELLEEASAARTGRRGG